MTTSPYPQATIDVVPEGEINNPNAVEYENQPGSALVTTQGNFSAFLAPLNQDSFREVVTGVEDKLRVFHQTLGMLDDVLDSQGFDAILNDMLQSITQKTGELLSADRTSIFLLDEEQHQLWSIVARDDTGKPLEIRIPADKGIAGEAATFKKVVNIPFDFYDDPRSTAAKEFDKRNHYRTYTMLAMPLVNEDDELVAVVQLINKVKSPHDPSAPLDQRISHGGFADQDIALFEDFAPSIRLILESSRSFYKATQRQRAAQALIDATNSLSKGNLDLLTLESIVTKKLL